MNFPRKEHYENLVGNIKHSLGYVGTDTCFYLYGSFIRPNDFVPGRSDIDGGFIFDSEFITPKSSVEFLARKLNDFLIGAEGSAGLSPSDSGIRVNFNLMDRATNRDGRFLAYDDTYTDYLKKNARIASGPDFLQEMNGMNYKRESLRSATYNLRKARNGLLTYFADLRKNPERARKSALSPIGLLWGTPKKLIEVCKKEIRFEGDKFFETFMEIFPGADLELFRKAQSLRRDPLAYLRVLGNMQTAYDLAFEFLNGTERMIKAYVERFPYHSRFEVNTLK